MATVNRSISDTVVTSETPVVIAVPANSWVQQFRQDFPEFANVAQYPTSVINFWYGVAKKFLDPNRWCDSINTGLELYVAHNVVLQAQSQRAVNAGGDPGLRTGVIAAENSGDQSVSYDVSSTAEQGAGFWNKTSYGQQYYHLAMLFGAGAIYLGAGCEPIDGSTAAWSGPPPWPIPWGFG